MPLTDTAIRAAKPAQTIQKLSDGGGLQLWVMPSGSKFWCLAYRDAGGKQKKLSFGPYPEITLAKAREKRDASRALIANGIDPVQQAKTDKANEALEKANSEANTFGAFATELLAKKKREGKASNTIGKREWLYSLAGDAFGNGLSRKSARRKYCGSCKRSNARDILKPRAACARRLARFSASPSPRGAPRLIRLSRCVVRSPNRR